MHWLVLEETTRFRTHAQAHWTDPEGEVRQNIIQDDIIRLDPDGFVATTRGRHGGTWAHWQLALSYARYLSPAFHLWCNTVVRAALAWHGDRPAADPSSLSFTAIDFETANRFIGSPCAVGLVRVRGGRVVAERSAYMRPPRTRADFDPGNTRIHGITEHTVAGHPGFAELWPQAAAIGGFVVVVGAVAMLRYRQTVD